MSNRRVLLAVTSPVSLKLMAGYPEYLDSHGWEVHLVVGGRPDGTYPSSINVHVIAMDRDPSPFRDAVALLEWVRLLRRVKPTYVVAGTPKAGLLGMLAAFACRVPARVYLLRGLRLQTEQGLRRRVLRVMEQAAAAAATKVQAVSESLREEFVSQRLAKQNKVAVLGSGSSNGVELYDLNGAPSVDRGELGTPQETAVVGYVGRLHRDKGLDTLLEGVARMRSDGLDVVALLVGPEEPAGALSALARSVGAPPESYMWVGAVADARPYYSAMDVLCLPTLREGFPNVVLEAAVRCVPAVVSDVTGARDSVIDGETGMLFRARDLSSLTSCLKAMILDSERRARLGESARRRAESEFSREVVWRRNEDFLLSLIER